MIRGHYPEIGLELFGRDVPDHTEADLRLMSEPIDFYGVNIYSGAAVSAGRDDGPHPQRPAGFANTHMGWPVEPRALYWGPRLLGERYGLPMVVCENGLASHDWVGRDGRVRDPARIDFLGRYLAELRRAAKDGVDVRGYFQWSFMDNFEWAQGYKYRFGLVHCDFQTLARTPKDSFDWYKRVVASNGRDLPEVADGA